MKTLVVGDIQGCIHEFLELLSKTGLSKTDRIIAVGDLIDRGPDSPAVIDYFRTHTNARSVMGNHEKKHIGWSLKQMEPAISQQLARHQFRKKEYKRALHYMKGLPSYIELPEAIVIHAFWEPGLRLKQQKEKVLVGLTSGEAYMLKNYKRSWWELYDGPKPLIAGHHDYSKKGSPVIYEDRVYLIDTGCCYGRSLTGLLLPDFKLVSVPARKNYWSIIKEKG